MTNFIESLKKGTNLSFEESKTLFNELMDGKYDENSIIEILDSLIKDKPLKPGSYRGRKNTSPEKHKNLNEENHA